MRIEDFRRVKELIGEREGLLGQQEQLRGLEEIAVFDIVRQRELFRADADSAVHKAALGYLAGEISRLERELRKLGVEA